MSWISNRLNGRNARQDLHNSSHSNQSHSKIPYCTMLSKYGQFTRKFKNIREANSIFFFHKGISTTLKSANCLNLTLKHSILLLCISPQQLEVHIIILNWWCSAQSRKYLCARRLGCTFLNQISNVFLLIRTETIKSSLENLLTEQPPWFFARWEK